MFDKFGGRKFTLALFGLLVITALMAFDKIADGVFSACFCAVIASYFAANVAQKATMQAPANGTHP